MENIDILPARMRQKVCPYNVFLDYKEGMRFSEERITLVSMDIEGMELNVLQGLEQCIKKNRPVLAICVYHKPEDIIELPLKVLEMVPDYRLYLRHYSYVETETVMYAI